MRIRLPWRAVLGVAHSTFSLLGVNPQTLATLAKDRRADGRRGKMRALQMLLGCEMQVG